ncbi:hypothetical protein HPSA_01600 [Helicobacter pylori SouthAfrica7]|uniref:Uncharacterized protein n=1 Tax=Helicobacter pylori (strain SouthAfrica7) TaxID=907239 RepID=E8QV55_HELPW|nr:hypothetical protein HPSA_01600 [Helicobacter pylori SouthAfrica7]
MSEKSFKKFRKIKILFFKKIKKVKNFVSEKKTL